MSDTSILVNLALILAAASLGGVLSIWFKQPVILGYLIAGVIVGPFTPGPHANVDLLRFLTEIGIALLLFVMGASITPSRFRGLGSVIFLGGAFQIALTVGLGLLLIPWFGLSLTQGFLIGAILAQSSSAVIAKILHDRRETDSVHGRVAIGISVIQDISSLPLLLLLLVFLGEGTKTVSSFLLAVGQVLGLAIITYFLGRLVWPRVLEWVGRLGSEELTLVTTLALALGGGLVVQAIGLSFALGAFLAGLVVAESPRRPPALTQVLPLRDVFAAIFFVAIGTQFNPAMLWQQIIPLSSILGLVLIGKAAISIVIVRLFRYAAPTAILAGLLLAQIGEFAFILANIGLERGAISEALFSVMIGAAVITIFANSVLLDSAPPVLSFLARVTGFPPLMKEDVVILASIFRRSGQTIRNRRPRWKP
jgi:CPA2 family monovalent cation:H+ antiporter-2